VARHSSLLLNIGPRPDGTFCPDEVALLEHFGRWMAVHGEAICGTQASPYNGDFAWGTVTQKNNVLYLQVLDAPAGPLVVPGVRGKIQAVTLLSTGKALPVESTDQEIRIRYAAPERKESGASSIEVVRVEFEQTPHIDASAQARYQWKVPNRGPEGINMPYQKWIVDRN